MDTEVRDEEFTLTAEVSLNDMFGCSSFDPFFYLFVASSIHLTRVRLDASQLRGMTQGKGEFTMEYLRHLPVLPNVQKVSIVVLLQLQHLH